MRWYKHIPNLLTLVNLALGCAAISLVFYDHIVIHVKGESYFFNGGLVWDKLHLGYMHLAAWLLVAAAAIDFMDGFVARALNATSEIGRQLDSLADVVTFGLVPGVMLYQLLALSLFDTVAAFHLKTALFLPAFLFTLTAAWRLAKFNIDETQRDRYHGLPVPAAALAVAGLVLAAFRQEAFVSRWMQSPWVMYGLILVFSLAMVSRWPVIKLSLNLRQFPGAKTGAVYTLLAVAVMLAGYFLWGILFGWWPVLILLYLLLSALTLKSGS